MRYDSYKQSVSKEQVKLNTGCSEFATYKFHSAYFFARNGLKIYKEEEKHWKKYIYCGDIQPVIRDFARPTFPNRQTDAKMDEAMAKTVESGKWALSS